MERTFPLPVSWLLAHEPMTAQGKLVVHPDDAFPFHLIPGGRDYPFAEANREFYFYETEHGVIWGLTAAILYRTMTLLKESANEWFGSPGQPE